MIRIVFLSVGLLLLAVQTVEAQASRPSVVVEAETVNWLPFAEALEKARATNKKLMIDVYAPWCGYCRRMHAETYSNEEVSDYLAENYIATRIDGDSEEKYSFMGHELSGTDLASQLGARGFPTTVFLYPSGQYLAPLPGFVPHEMFGPVLRYISTDAFESQSFDEFAESQ